MKHTRPKKLCILCRAAEAQVPDRERMGAPVKRVCRACHAKRLLRDAAELLRPPTPEDR